MHVTRLAELAYVVELDSDNVAEFDFSKLSSSLLGLIDYAPAYGRIGLFFENKLPEIDIVEQAICSLRRRVDANKLHEIPICFEMGEDFAEVCESLNLTIQDFKEEFLNAEFRVEAIGFTPGFPYMSRLAEKLSGTARRESPRPRVPQGSVGIAEAMCGIYPAIIPGGWNLIGRTPLVIADMAEAYFRFQVGDQVRFEEISQIQFDSKFQAESETR